MQNAATAVPIRTNLNPKPVGGARRKDGYLEIVLDVQDPDVVIHATGEEHLENLNGVKFYSNKPCRVSFSPNLVFHEKWVDVPGGTRPGTTHCTGDPGSVIYKVDTKNRHTAEVETEVGYELPCMTAQECSKMDPRLVVP